MKKIILCGLFLLSLFVLWPPECLAASAVPDPMDQLRSGVSDEVLEKMRAMGADHTSGAVPSVSLTGVFSLFVSELASALGGPLSGAAVAVGALILAAVAEGYTHQLRYTETRDVMAAVTALVISASLITPLVGLIRRSAGVISANASLMLIYVPIMAGLIAMSGHPIRATGACASVMTASQVVSQLSARLFPQAMCAYLAIGVSCGVSGRMRAGGLCELLGKFIKWLLGVVMTLFTAVLSLQSFTSAAGDTLASRAARLTLSSLIPLIGSSLSEAYKTIQSSMDLLRSGAGVFVILALLTAYLPIVLQAFLWLMSVRVCGCVAEALGVESPVALLNAVGSVLTVLIALMFCVMAVFVISTALLIRVGGAA